MRTTVRLPDALLKKAKQQAHRRNTTLTALLEEGLRYVVRKTPVSRSKQHRVRLPTFRGKEMTSGLDLSDSSALLDILEKDTHVSTRR